jgi:hypothetical protein
MRSVLPAIAIALLFTSIACAQHGTAPSGYYPFGYHGDTWTGTVLATNNVTHEITLTFTKKDKTETFIGVFPDNNLIIMQDGSTRILRPSDIPLNTRIEVFYVWKTKKVNGAKVTYNEIFQINLAPDSSNN